MNKRFHYFYTRVFYIVGIITLFTIGNFGVLAGINGFNTIKERTLSNNERILYQIDLSVVDGINSLKTTLLTIYESEDYYATVSALFETGEQQALFNADPFYKKTLNQEMLKIFDEDDVYVVFFTNYTEQAVLSHNILLGSWEVQDSSSKSYQKIEEITTSQQLETINLGDYYASSNSAFNVILVQATFNPVNGTDHVSITCGYSRKFVETPIDRYELDGETLILNGAGDVIFSNNTVLGSYVLEHFEQFAEAASKSVIAFNGKEYYLTKLYDQEHSLYFINCYEKGLLVEAFSNNAKFILLAILVSLLALSIVYYIANRIYGKRTARVIHALELLDLDNLDSRIEGETGNDEFAVIAKEFNMMCDALKENIDKSYVYQLKEKEAELEEIQAKINPHFLYNTLECIRECIVSGDKEQAEDMIVLLSSVFRSTVKRKTIITIREELEIDRMILELFSIRFGDFFTYDIRVDDDILQYLILKNIQQPMIENYFKHGIDYSREDNHFSLVGYKENEHIIFEFQDNGRGIGEAKLQEIRRALAANTLVEDYHYGLANVNERIKLVFGIDCTLAIESHKGKGTKITMKIKAFTADDIKRSGISF